MTFRSGMFELFAATRRPKLLVVAYADRLIWLYSRLKLWLHLQPRSTLSPYVEAVTAGIAARVLYRPSAATPVAIAYTMLLH